MVQRIDAWTKKDDELLASVILETIATGGVQLDAFESVARILNRTPSACGYRWNGIVRKVYLDEIIEAKRKRRLSTSNRGYSKLPNKEFVEKWKEAQDIPGKVLEVKKLVKHYTLTLSEEEMIELAIRLNRMSDKSVLTGLYNEIRKKLKV